MELVLLLRSNVPQDYLRYCLAPYRSDKVFLTLQLSSSQLITQPWVTSEQLLRRYTLPRWRCQKQIHMVRYRFHGSNLQLVPFHDPTKDLLQAFCYWLCQDGLSVLGNLNEMVLEIVDSVFSTFDRTHSSYRSGLIHLRRISVFLPTTSSGVSSGVSLVIGFAHQVSWKC